jgi:hypothetical protein
MARTTPLVARPPGDIPHSGDNVVDSAAQVVPPPASPVADAMPPAAVAPVRRDRSRLLRAATLAGALALGLAGGFAGSAFHPGSNGKTGAVGAVGPAGSVGPAGPTGQAGAAAQVAELGVCYSTTSGTSGVYYLNGIYITSPLKHADGTTYCESGSYVPVAPQTQNSSGGGG